MYNIDLDMRQVQARFEKIQKKASNPKKGFSYIGALAWRDVMAHFAKQQTPGGRKWPGWKVTKDGKTKRVNVRPGKGGTKLLMDTGRLRESTIYKATRDDAIVSNDVEYAGYQNRMRKFMGLSKQAKKVLLQYFTRFLLR